MGSKKYNKKKNNDENKVSKNSERKNKDKDVNSFGPKNSFNKDNINKEKKPKVGNVISIAEEWLKENNSFKDYAEISISFSKKVGCLIGDKFSVGIRPIDERNYGTNIVNALGNLFHTNNKPNLILNNIEDFLKNNKTELRIEVGTNPYRKPKYFATIYDQNGPSEIRLKNTNADDLETALELLDTKIFESYYNKSDSQEM
jgi:hypothetical protein